MKTFSLTLLATLIVTTAHARSIDCFSKFYTRNQFDLQIKAVATSNTALTQFKIESAGAEIKKTYANLTGQATRTNKDKYRGYNSYFLMGANPVGSASAHDLELRLPNNIMSPTVGNFTAYLSDAMADADGSDGFFKLICH